MQEQNISPEMQNALRQQLLQKHQAMQEQLTQTQ